MAQIRMLVVDDILLQRRMMSSVLGAYGAIDFATNGNEAVIKFNSALNEGKPYQLICMDISMPQMDGIEALRRIRDAEKRLQMSDDKRVRILMVTGQNDSKSVVNALQNHCDGYMLKPLLPDALREKLKGMGFPPPLNSSIPPPSGETQAGQAGAQ